MRRYFDYLFSSKTPLRAAFSDALCVVVATLVLKLTIVETVNNYSQEDPEAAKWLTGYYLRDTFVSDNPPIYLLLLGAFTALLSLFAMMAASNAVRVMPKYRSIFITVLAVLAAVALIMGIGMLLHASASFYTAFVWFEYCGLVAVPAALRLTSRNAFSYRHHAQVRSHRRIAA